MQTHPTAANGADRGLRKAVALVALLNGLYFFIEFGVALSIGSVSLSGRKKLLFIIHAYNQMLLDKMQGKEAYFLNFMFNHLPGTARRRRCRRPGSEIDFDHELAGGSIRHRD